MDHEFWHERWRRGDIGFHRTEVHWALELYWMRIAEAHCSDSRVLVPLCGKSLDLIWLAGQGFRVQGVELSRKAITEFFAEAGRVPERHAAGALTRWSSGPIEIHEGDFFAFEPDAPAALFYDRAAVVALPEAMRMAYLARLRGLLAPGAAGLLVSFESRPPRFDGPPFDVTEAELRAADGFAFELLERRPVAAPAGAVERAECAWWVRAV